MATLEQLMQYGTRRKVEKVGSEMGYPKGTIDYPNEVLEEVKKQHGKKSVSARAQDAAEHETADTAEHDLHSIQQAAENRAAGMLVAFDSLTMMHVATRKFADPKLQKAVDESQIHLRQMLGNVASTYEPEAFLAGTPLAQIAAGGENGSMRSLPTKNSSSNEPSPNGSRKPDDKGIPQS